MKNLKISMIFIAILIFIFLIYAGFFYQPYYPGPDSEGPIPDLRTNREKRFCDSLMAINYPEVKINKRIYFDHDKGIVRYSYIFSYKRTPAFNENQADSINLENIRLITRLLSHYCTDRILYENEIFYIDYDDIQDCSYRPLNKKTVAQLCGFKVIKLGKYKYKRIYTREKGSPTKLIIPQTWLRNDNKYW